MHPNPRHRTFEGAGSGDPLPRATDGPDLPVEGHAVLLDKTFPCPRPACTGRVGVRAMLWVDDWPVPDADEGKGDGERRARTLHLSVARLGLEEQKSCTAGCVLTPEEWQCANSAAFLSLCAAYTEEVRRLREVVSREEDRAAP